MTEKWLISFAAIGVFFIIGIVIGCYLPWKCSRFVVYQSFQQTFLCINGHISVASGGGGAGNAGTFPPPETGKIVVEIWCYLPEVYTFGAESEIQEIFSKKL